MDLSTSSLFFPSPPRPGLGEDSLSAVLLLLLLPSVPFFFSLLLFFPLPLSLSLLFSLPSSSFFPPPPLSPSSPFFLSISIYLSMEDAQQANVTIQELKVKETVHISLQSAMLTALSQISDGGKEIDQIDVCGATDSHGFCAICLERIPLIETALIKGCEHAYCVTCILRWATYSKNPCCPQCKHPFYSLDVHRSLDGRVQDYMFEESVCLLLRASWFVPLTSAEKDEAYEDQEDVYFQYEDDDDLEENYFGGSSSIRIGNRRWGDNGYIRAGRKEAKPIVRERLQHPSAGTSRGSRHKETSIDVTGRRAKRALKREAADRAAAAKHQQHLQRLGRQITFRGAAKRTVMVGVWDPLVGRSGYKRGKSYTRVMRAAGDPPCHADMVKPKPKAEKAGGCIHQSEDHLTSTV
ncbi:hypothetical protein ACLOJK_024701 [Asimina triloba]